MLSAALNRKLIFQRRRNHTSPPDESTALIKRSFTPLPTLAATKTDKPKEEKATAINQDSVTTPLTSADTIISLHNSIFLKVPKKTPGWIWDSWNIALEEIKEEDENSGENFIKDLLQRSIEIEQRIDNYDTNTNTVQSITSFGTAFLALLQTTVAATQLLSTDASRYTTVGVSAIDAIFALFAKFISAQIVVYRNEALKLKGDIDEILEAPELAKYRR